MNRRHFLVLLGGGAVLVGGAAVGLSALPEHPPTFPEIAYGEERCAYCGMSIDDRRFASAWWAKPGSAERRFDDIGCMVATVRRDRPGPDIDFFTHDYNTETWLDATAATYLVSPQIKTPMSWAVLAVPSPEAARDLPARDSATVYDWSTLLDRLERSV